tara:strand:+ start:407 stop:619 length:213 start_codon:yes stop_codon:yes gene_type:complete
MLGVLDMKWWETLWKQDVEQDTWKDPDPEDLSIDNAYKTRWIWYHTILGIGIFMVNILLIAILIVLAVKL